jgi:hypothetical protein
VEENSQRKLFQKRMIFAEYLTSFQKSENFPFPSLPPSPPLLPLPSFLPSFFSFFLSSLSLSPSLSFLVIKLRASHFLYSTKTQPQYFFFISLFQIWSHTLAWPPPISSWIHPSCNWDYRYAPPCLTKDKNLMSRP